MRVELSTGGFGHGQVVLSVDELVLMADFVLFEATTHGATLRLSLVLLKLLLAVDLGVLLGDT